MRKLIFLLFTITFTLVSFLSIKQFEFLEFQSFNYKDNSEKLIVEIQNGNPQKNSLENFQLLTGIASKAKVNIQRISYEKNENQQNKIVYYVALCDYSNYFKKIKLKNGYYLNINSNSNYFLSTIKTGNINQIGQIEIFHSFDPIEIRPMIAAAKIKDIKGSYTIDNYKNAKKFMELATNYGFSLKIHTDDSSSVFTNYPYQDMIYITYFALCLLILLAISYDVMNNYKAVAIQYMHGHTFFDIGKYVFKRYYYLILSSFAFVIIGLFIYLYFYNEFQQVFAFLDFWVKNILNLYLLIIFIFIFVWISTKNIEITQMIKNKKPLKLFFYLNIIVRFVLAIILILGLEKGIDNYQELRNTNLQLKRFELLRNYSYLGIELNQFDSHDNNQLKKFKELYQELENQGAIYISPSTYYLKDDKIKLNPNPWGIEGKQVVINKNYLSLNPIYDLNNNIIKLTQPSKNELTILVPIKYKVNQDDIKKTIKKDYSIMLNLKNPEVVKINIIYVRNQQSYFTFSTQFAIDSEYLIKDPIAVIITPEFEPLFISSTINMGYGYYTKNTLKDNSLEKTKETFKKYGFRNIWKPSIAYGMVEQQIAQNTEKLRVTIIYCILFLVLCSILLLFSSIYYLEINKQLLALQWIFGYSYLEKHYLAYFALLVFWQLSFMICFFISNQILLLIKICIALAVFDFLLFSLLLILKEFKVTKEVLIDK